MDFHSLVFFPSEYNSLWPLKCGGGFELPTTTERIFITMWKPTNQPATPGRPAEPERASTPTAAPATSEPAPAPRPITTTTSDQATIGKSLVIKGEVTAGESLYIDGQIEGSVTVTDHRVTVGRNGSVKANIIAREVVIMGKVTGNVECSDRVDIRSEGTLNGDVVSARISVEDGAMLRGSVQLNPSEQKQDAPKAMGAAAGKN